ncbi:hypothetical protein QWY86_05760 [Pedobacter aquatilis]|uniref:hypothetical protein n=1 Tax=Pedobacter aquatilis TaxID=351343 RepID=UPI0025B384EC|nr:hypothetical protein [Pedobacter aquatilis]MDN3586162.1 hypothetical protein [Pedobacter aquatilis]
MKTTIFFVSCLAFFSGAHAQTNIRDEHITNQQERMVFKSWDKDSFTPKPGFLGLNPLYWLTWGLHPNYPDTDLRPLGPLGPQSNRLALAVALSAAENRYKMQSDSIRQTAEFNFAQHSGLLSDFDPLWNLYYSSVLEPLKSSPLDLFSGLRPDVIIALNRSGFVSWYQNEHKTLRERLTIARNSDMEKGSRIIYYHRLLLDYRKLQANWEEKKRLSGRWLDNRDKKENILKREKSTNKWAQKDIEIVDRILKNSRL